LLPVLLECLDCQLGELHGAPASRRFRCEQDQTNSSSPLNCLTDADSSSLEVNIDPLKTQSLTKTEASSAKQHPERM
jgi:hypothetical protein